jgi:hypothetical protein
VNDLPGLSKSANSREARLKIKKAAAEKDFQRRPKTFSEKPAQKLLQTVNPRTVKKLAGATGLAHKKLRTLTEKLAAGSGRAHRRSSQKEADGWRRTAERAPGYELGKSEYPPRQRAGVTRHITAPPNGRDHAIVASKPQTPTALASYISKKRDSTQKSRDSSGRHYTNKKLAPPEEGRTRSCRATRQHSKKGGQRRRRARKEGCEAKPSYRCVAKASYTRTCILYSPAYRAHRNTDPQA